ncbi:hypothetical protein K8M07_07720 [Schnuerera sp. xch1]|uniref:M14 family zinc carboxypeptidase n=1 Tax=Schnuerera sp. xch1 TaxID=2874283 RepID=UPI001CBB43FF|nr:M14 family zinc carboxypeptidase [Schnuerera sp. xch1]MBZ2175142.1 hypothetical protein [Schnuerera sp. xch1]
MKKFISVMLLVVLVTTPLTVLAKQDSSYTNLVEVNWDKRHDFEFHEKLLQDLEKEHPKIAKTYSIGRSWREQDIWCIELTSNKKNIDNKTKIAVFGNIHGNEQESGEAAAYTAWWLVTNYNNDKEVKNILDNYVIYVVPIINPDGYEQSFIYPTRENLRPTDHNGNNRVFSDPYTDINGDGVIAQIYTGAKDSEIYEREYIGMESPDWNENGIPGDDPKQSNIDLNRTFNYMWNYMDVDSTPVQGSNAYTRAGNNPASEPEVKAVQNFLIKHPVHAMVTLHTGIQCVLYPWCYTDEEPEDAEFLKKVSTEMAKAFEKATGRKSYVKQSFDDYPTSAEMIDWTYGRLGIHSYTMEIYRPGKPVEDGAIEEQCTWGNELPEDEWIYMGNWNGMEDIWFRNTSKAQMVGVAPPEQSLMLKGTKNAILKMIENEPYGSGPQVPEYIK